MRLPRITIVPRGITGPDTVTMRALVMAQTAPRSFSVTRSGSGFGASLAGAGLAGAGLVGVPAGLAGGAAGAAVDAAADAVDSAGPAGGASAAALASRFQLNLSRSTAATRA
jgi:hypothetical protein